MTVYKHVASQDVRSRVYCVKHWWLILIPCHIRLIWAVSKRTAQH